MNENLKIFILLLKKNFFIRKKHWIFSLIIQIIIPICFILVSELTRPTLSNLCAKPKDLNNLVTESDIIRNDKRILRYTPHLPLTNKIMNFVKTCVKPVATDVIGYSSEDTMIEAVLVGENIFEKGPRSQPVSIVFESIVDENIPEFFKYKIRPMCQWATALYDPTLRESRAASFLDQSWLAVQLCLDKAYINLFTNKTSKFNTTMLIQDMPKKSQCFFWSTEHLLPFTNSFVVFLIIVACIEIVYPANERNSGINISMNGGSYILNLLSWLISGMILNTIFLITLIVIINNSFFSSSQPFLQNGNNYIVLLALFLHTIHTICFGYHLSSYFSTPYYSIIAAIFILICGAIMKFWISIIGISHYSFYLGMIISPLFLLDKTFSEISRYETQEVSLSWSNFYISSEISENSFEKSIAMIIILSILGGIFHFFMTICINSIFPGKYGISNNLFSFFLKKKSIDENKLIKKYKGLDTEFNTYRGKILESGIQIKELTKTYKINWFKKNKIHALNGISIDFYKNQITALLGPNGAGKTTMLSILSGSTSPTKGKIFIEEQNILFEPKIISNKISLCTQENILYPELTVYQHLMFFISLKKKTLSKKLLEKEIELYLLKVNLIDKKNYFPNQLSEGQKRKLCIAIAICGNANVLIFDEPTSGLDIISKYEVWDIILKLKESKTVIFSTHDIEEANILGDQIAIMHKGKLKTYGNFTLLKKLYGNGQTKIILSMNSPYDLQKILYEIGIEGNIIKESNEKIILEFPSTNLLPKAIAKLEKSKEKLKISKISVLKNTLEQIFLKVTDEKSNQENLKTNEINDNKKITGFCFFIQIFLAFFMKKFAYAKNNPGKLCISLFLPSLLTAILFSFSLFSINKPLDFTLNAYPNSAAFIQLSNLSTNHDILMKMFKKTIENYERSIIISEEKTNITNAILNYAEKNKQNIIIAAEIYQNQTNIIIKGFYENTAVRSVSVVMNCISNALAKTLTNNENLKIHVSVQDISPNVDFINSSDGDFTYEKVFLLTITILLTATLSFYVIQPLKEITSGMKKLQNMSIASKFCYWPSIFIFDLIQYIISIILLVGSLVLIDYYLKMKMYYFEELSLIILFFILYGISILPLIYIISLTKISQNFAIILLNILPISLYIFNLISQVLFERWGVKFLISIQEYVINNAPTVIFFKSLPYFLKRIWINSKCRCMSDFALKIFCKSNPHDQCCQMNCVAGVCEKSMGYFDAEKYGEISFITAYKVFSISFVILSFIIIIIEQHFFSKIISIIKRKYNKAYNNEMDESVYKENQIVKEDVIIREAKMKGIIGKNIMVAQDLKKNCGKLKRIQVIKGINFGIRKGECFGLLGLNGVGKSTIFNMMTGYDIAHGGKIYFKNFGIHNNLSQYQNKLGYCPQKYVLMDSLNAWEHLYLFGKLRGVPRSKLNSVVKKWIQALDLTDFADKPCETYSGGNKKKLNIAISLIGNPSLILMDEMTTGIDPIARTLLWNILKKCQNNGQSIIISSHNMKECEDYCDRVAILKNGQFACIGEPDELKQKFNAGYTVKLKISTNVNFQDMELIKRKIETTVICKKIDESSGYLEYHVTDANKTWISIYEIINDLKNHYDSIEDFEIDSETLAQLFFKFDKEKEHV